MTEGKSTLQAAVPGVQVEANPVTTAPEVVDATFAGGALTAPSREKPETVVRNFLSANAKVFGLGNEQVAQLKTVADYSNPAGNLSWVELQQTLNGIPVFQGTIRAAVRRDGAIVRTTGNLAPGLDEAALAAPVPKLGPAAAVAMAAKSIGVTVEAASLEPLATAEEGRTVTLAAGPFSRETRTELTYFPIEPGLARLAYSMVLWQPVDAYYILVDAETGQLLWRKNITNDQSQSVTYSVYGSDSPNPISPTTAKPGSGTQGTAVPRSTITLISELPAFDDLGWIPDGANTTTGNNVDAGLDLSSPNGIDTGSRPVGSPNRVFNFPYTPGGQSGGQDPSDPNFRLGVVTNLFFWTNRYHDRLYAYGFNEAARNFQQSNFSRGGVGNDRVLAEAQDSGGTNNANFATPPDGQSGRMQMYIFDGPTPARDGSLDQEVVLHELTHGLSNRLHSNGSGLTTLQAGGMGEGWSDFYARCLLSTVDEDVAGVYASGAYATRDFFGLGTDNSYYGIRRFPYAIKTTLGANGKPHNPMTLADVDPGQLFTGDGAFPRSSVIGDAAIEVHNIGEIWCMALLEVRARMIARLGFAGNDHVLQIVTDAMKMDPASPTILQARNSIVAAAGSNSQDVADIWAGFAAMGMGFNASISAGTNQNYPASVVESFITPNLVLGTVTFSDANANNNGFADPGEMIVLTVPVSNLLTTAATGAMVSVDGGVAVSYGTIAASATVTKTINYTVPAGTPPGTRLKVPVAINSSLGTVGPVQPSFFLIVGKPVAGFTQNFDALPGTALPSGWTTARTGAGTTWTVSTTNSDSAPKNAFTPNVGSAGTAELVTPGISITSPSSQLTFQNLFNLESGGGPVFYDGMVLEISINGGAFKDILLAGGSFLTGGYNASLEFTTNTLSGRNAWGGLSGGGTSTPSYITTKVLLPASATGKTVRFKWIVGCDEFGTATGSAGVRIDGVSVTTDATVDIPNFPPVVNDQAFSVADSAPNGKVVGTVAASDPNSGQTLSYAITAGNTNSAFAIDSTSGQITVANNTALNHNTMPVFMLTVQVTDNGIPPLSDTATVTINVKAPGASPVINGQNPLMTLEEQNLTIQLTDLMVTDSDSPGYPAGFSLTVLNGTNYVHSGNTITPAADFVGMLSVPVTVSDGETDSAVFNASVTVNPVNDAPSFVKGPDQPIVSDGATHMVPNWATGILAGPPDEQMVQMLDFLVTTDNDNFFSSVPVVSAADGTLTFAAKPGMIGTVTVTVTLHDDGGTANMGVNVSAPQAFVISSTLAANDPPSFIVGPDQAAAQDGGPQTVVNFAKAVSPGPPDEANQVVHFNVDAANHDLFDEQPTIIVAGTPGALTGTLKYTPKATANGTTLVTVTLKDDGGTANGGNDTSAPQTFSISVTTFVGHDGTYNGLALPASGAQSGADKTGLMQVKFSSTGVFTGTLKLGVFSFGLRGTINKAGVVLFGKTNTEPLLLERNDLPSLLLSLRLDVAGDSDKITGTINEKETGAPFSVVSADRAIYTAKDVGAPFKLVPPELLGKYTVIFNATGVPQGAGFCTVEVTSKGVAKLTGLLSDGSKVGYTNALSKDNRLPLYQECFKGNGALAGYIQFHPLDGDLDGKNLLWFKPEDFKNPIYPGGWPGGIKTTLVGSRYTPADTVAASFVPDPGAILPTSAHLTLTNGNLSSETKTLQFDGKKVNVPPPDPHNLDVKVTVTTKTGLFKGSFVHPFTRKPASFQGAILQKQRMASGYFFGFNQAGLVTIVPD
ncbi:MAG: extracellular elastinolytic metalloproteinase [Chthoniobacter sp.]|jgi:hypothetical protein|nr:extracellular elastinolytic metalloproteinase [Chthoniobacter sp.]